MLKNILLFSTILVLVACTPKVKGLQSSSKAKGSQLSEAQRMTLTSLYIDAQKERMLGNLYESDKLLKQCLTIDQKNHAVIYDRALIATALNFAPEALELAEQAVSLAPDNMWYQLLTADLYLNQNQFDKAEKAYERVVNDHEEGFEYLYDLSMVRYRQGDIPGSIKALERVEDKMGFSEEIFQQKHLLYMESGQSDKAIAQLEKAIASSPKEPMYYGMMAEVYESMGNSEKAFDYYQQILEFDPENGMVQLSLYEYYVQNGETEKAEQALNLGFADEVIDIDTKVAILLNFYELSEGDTERREEALNLCRKLIEVYPEEAKAHAIYGDFLLRESRFEEARESFLAAVDIDPSRAIIWNEIIAIDSQLQDYQSMVAHSEESIELFPASPGFYLLNGIANNQLNQSEEAIEILEAGKQMVFDDDATLLEFYSALGDSYNEMKNYVESDKAFDKALTINPENVYVLNNYSYYLSLRKSKLEKAQNMALRANEISPNSASFEDTYAWVLYVSEKYAEARLWIEKAIAHGGGGSGVIREHYGDILFQLGDEDLAKQEWSKALEFGDYSEFLEQKVSSGKLIE